MKKLLVLLMASLVGLLAGCSTTSNISTASAPIQSMVHADVIANIEVGEKISATVSNDSASSKYADGIAYQVGYVSEINEPPTLLTADLPLIMKISAWPVVYIEHVLKDSKTFSEAEAVKAQAAFKAVSNSGADVIIMPRYETTIKRRLLRRNLITVKVEGYKGTYREFSQSK